VDLTQVREGKIEKIGKKFHVFMYPLSKDADLGCLPRIPDPNFFRPGTRIKKIPDTLPASGSASKNLSILTQKIVF
jgi:hypothetical protein